MKITENIFNVGVNDYEIDLFEGQYGVENGMAYNSYVICDDKVAVLDTVDKNFGAEWLSNIENILGDKNPDYLIVQHMEPDHSANIDKFMDKYPDATIVASSKAFTMINQFFGMDVKEKAYIVNEGKIGTVTQHLYDTLTGIQWGKIEDRYGWTYPVEK